MKFNIPYNFSPKSIISFLILLFIGLFMVHISWQKWPDVLIDFGRELYIPWQLNNGAVLYRDIAYFNGPFSPYFNSFLFKIFGTGLMTIAIFNLILIAVLTYLIYQIFLKTTNILVATMTGAVFLGMSAFCQYCAIGNHTYVTPYSHELTHGLILSFFAIYAFLIYLKHNKNIWLAFIGMSVGAVFLMKMEIFIAIFIAIIIGLCFMFFSKDLALTEVLKKLGIFFLGFLFPIICFMAYLSCYMPFSTVLSSLIISYKILFQTSVASHCFYLKMMGINKPFINLMVMFAVFILYIALLLFLGLTSFIFNKISNKKLQAVVIGCAFIIITILMPVFITEINWETISRPFPIILLLLGAYYFFTLWHYKNNQQKIKQLLPLFVLTIFGFLLLLKIILNAGTTLLATPAALLTVMALLYHMPLWLSKKFNNASTIRILIIVLISIIFLSNISLSKHNFSLKTYAVGSGKNKIITLDSPLNSYLFVKGSLINLTLQKIEELIKQDENFVVMPEGVMLNYLSKRKNPCPYINFVPTDIEMFGGEEQILNSLNKCSPDYIILLDRKLIWYDDVNFGADYAVNIFSWVKKNYAPVYSAGKQPFTNQGFGVVIMKRI